MAKTFILGGAGADELNAGIFTTGGSATFTNSQDTGGAALFTDDAILATEITDNGTTVTIARAGIDTGIVVDHWVFVDWADGTFADGRFRVSAVASGSITIDFGGDAGNKPTLDTTKLRIGGAVKEGAASDTTQLQAIFDSAVVGDLIKIQGDLTIGAKIDIDQSDGTAVARIAVVGVDTAGVELSVGDTYPIITPGAAIAAGMFEVGEVDYWKFTKLDLNGDGGGANVANHCINLSTALGVANQVTNCELHGSNLSCLRNLGTVTSIIFCDIHTSGSDRGLEIRISRCFVLGCSIHDNALMGVSSITTDVQILHCTIYNNGSDGIDLSAVADRVQVSNTIMENNGAAGLLMASGADDCRIFNNSSCNNTTYGYELTVDDDRHELFSGNHANGNGIASVDVGAWADVGQGGNTVGEPQFAQIGTNYAIGNADVLQSGVIGLNGRKLLIGADAINLTGIFDRTRVRYSSSTHGYSL